MLKFSRNSFAYVLIFVALVAIFFTFYSGNVNSTEIPITRVISEAQKGTLDKIEISTNGRLKIINKTNQEWVEINQEDFSKLIKNSAMKRTKYSNFVRNVKNQLTAKIGPKSKNSISNK